MWSTKTFKTREALEAWVARNEGRYQWHQIYINNVPYVIKYKRLRVIG